jgi:hypothetical protein
VLRYGLPLATTGFDRGAVGAVWAAATWTLAPFSVVASTVDPMVRGLPEWVDIVVTLALGLVPYLALDHAWRAVVRPRRSPGPVDRTGL